MIPFWSVTELVDHIPDLGDHIYVFMRQINQGLDQHLDLALQIDVTIDNAVHAALDEAKPTFHGNTGGPKTLFRYGYAQFFSQILKILINLFWFHGG